MSKSKIHTELQASEAGQADPAIGPTRHRGGWPRGRPRDRDGRRSSVALGVAGQATSSAVPCMFRRSGQSSCCTARANLERDGRQRERVGDRFAARRTFARVFLRREGEQALDQADPHPGEVRPPGGERLGSRRCGRGRPRAGAPELSAGTGTTTALTDAPRCVPAGWIRGMCGARTRAAKRLTAGGCRLTRLRADYPHFGAPIPVLGAISLGDRRNHRLPPSREIAIVSNVGSPGYPSVVSVGRILRRRMVVVIATTLVVVGLVARRSRCVRRLSTRRRRRCC